MRNNIQELEIGEVLLTIAGCRRRMEEALEHTSHDYNDELQSLCGNDEETEDMLTERAGELLKHMEVSARMKGYRYLCQAISIAAMEPQQNIWVTKEIYPMVAKKEHTTAAGVERAIRYAVTSIWERGNWELYFRITDNLSVHKPTNGQFIVQIARYFLK